MFIHFFSYDSLIFILKLWSNFIKNKNICNFICKNEWLCMIIDVNIIFVLLNNKI
jgi:hypothetical protein